MSQTIAPLETRLHKAHLSLTQPRKLIFNILQSSEPLSVAELLSQCQHINRASVYRTLGLFEQLGITQRLQIGWKYKIELSNAFQQHHHHLTCLVCETVIALPEDNLLEEQLARLTDKHDFTAQDHQLEIRGLCANCRV